MSDKFDLHNYDDIIDMPHYTSPSHKRMDVIDRAAQFSPFAALTGYDAAVEEAARLTDEKRELSEDVKAIIDAKIQMIADCLDDAPEVSITYFVPDEKKAGGAYANIVGVVKAVDAYEHCIVMTDQRKLYITRIRDINSRFFQCFDIE